jgi:hypothetical protein
MITPTCTKCRRPIPREDVNVANDVAYCRECNLSHKLSALTSGAELELNLDLRSPPKGVWVRSGGLDTVIGATHRSLGAAIAMLCFGLFWNGIVSVFVLLAVSATLHHLDIAVPEWFPAPKMNGGDMGVGMTIFLWIFLTPFIAIGLFFIGSFLSCLLGRTEVRLRASQGAVFTGIGTFGYTRRFNTTQVNEVRIDDRQWRDSDGDRRRNVAIIIETSGGKPIKFGSMLSDERRQFVAGALRRLLVR